MSKMNDRKIHEKYKIIYVSVLKKPELEIEWRSSVQFDTSL